MQLMLNEETLPTYINKAKILSELEYDYSTRIAILSSFTVNGLQETIRVKCSQYKIQCETYDSGYNQYNQEILNSNSDLYKFKPEITFLIIDTRTALSDLYFNLYSLSVEERKKFVQEKSNEIINIVKQFSKKSKSKIILSNFTTPSYSPYGINEINQEFGLQEMIRVLNQKIKNGLKDEPLAYIFDLESFVIKYGERNIFDYKQFFYADVKISLEYLPYLAEELMRYIKPFLGLSKKCIVLDLDNILWGGIVGEDGFEEIKLGDDPIGRSYLEFQKNLLALNKRGIILTINSKNNYDDAIDVINKHPNMVLKEENFACLKINWSDKVSNMQEISNELNIGLDSMVFFDDDPVNRELIRTRLPQVLTVELTDSSNYTNILQSITDFEVLNITIEDTQRGKMYSEERKRSGFKDQIENLDDFLEQLNISVKIKQADKFTIPRISQLTRKTNQFNLTTKRYQEEEIEAFSKNKNKIVECAEVKDKFGNNGITGVYIINKDNETEWSIDTFLLSCRIMGRGVEEGLLSNIIERAKKENVLKIKAQFIQTKKNMPAKNFLADFGFKKDGDNWYVDTNQQIKKSKHLHIE